MPLDETVWHVGRLKEQLDEERKAHEQAMQKAKARQQVASRKRR